MSTTNAARSGVPAGSGVHASSGVLDEFEVAYTWRVPLIGSGASWLYGIGAWVALCTTAVCSVRMVLVARAQVSEGMRAWMRLSTDLSTDATEIASIAVAGAPVYQAPYSLVKYVSFTLRITRKR